MEFNSGFKGLTASGFTRPDHDQQRCYHHAPTVKSEAVNAVVSIWWWEWRHPKHVEPHINVK